MHVILIFLLHLLILKFKQKIMRTSDSNVVFTITDTHATLHLVMLIFYSTCLLSCFGKDRLLLLPTNTQKRKKRSSSLDFANWRYQF